MPFLSPFILLVFLGQNPSDWAMKLFPQGTSHDFGKVEPGVQIKHSFPMKNPYKQRVEIAHVRASCGCLTWKASKTVLKSGESASFDVVLDTRRFSGKKNFVMFVTMEPILNLKDQGTATLHLSADCPRASFFKAQGQTREEGKAVLSVSPSVLPLGRIRVGDRIVRKILVQGQRPFRITAVHGQGEGLKVDMSNQSAASQVITLTCQPTRSGEFQRRLTIHTDLENLSVPVSIEAQVGP